MEIRNLASHLASYGVTVREAEIILEVSKGFTNKEVASKLFVTEKTIKFHLTNIFKKLSVKSRSQLIVAVNPLINKIQQSQPQEKEEKPKEDPSFPSNVPTLPGGHEVDV